MRAPAARESTTYRQKWKSRSTSIASWVNPRRLERMASPARSWVVKIRPTLPLAAWLWFVCSARVLLPESMVPVKKWSSAIARRLCHDVCRRRLPAQMVVFPGPYGALPRPRTAPRSAACDATRPVGSWLPGPDRVWQGANESEGLGLPVSVEPLGVRGLWALGTPRPRDQGTKVKRHGTAPWDFAAKRPFGRRHLVGPDQGRCGNRLGVDALADLPWPDLVRSVDRPGRGVQSWFEPPNMISSQLG